MTLGAVSTKSVIGRSLIAGGDTIGVPMLARYKIIRGKRPPSDPLPNGERQDTRWRCRKHPLRTTEAAVKRYLAAPNEKAWRWFRRAYLAELEKRFLEDRVPFDILAELAGKQDVFIGCSCPTKANPRFDRCHTWLALEFMKRKYPKLRVSFPQVQK